MGVSLAICFDLSAFVASVYYGGAGYDKISKSWLEFPMSQGLIFKPQAQRSNFFHHRSCRCGADAENAKKILFYIFTFASFASLRWFFSSAAECRFCGRGITKDAFDKPEVIPCLSHGRIEFNCF
jgi:hypothetical protein